MSHLGQIASACVLAYPQLWGDDIDCELCWSLQTCAASGQSEEVAEGAFQGRSGWEGGDRAWTGNNARAKPPRGSFDLLRLRPAPEVA